MCAIQKWVGELSTTIKKHLKNGVRVHHFCDSFSFPLFWVLLVWSNFFFKCNLHFFSFVKNWWTTIVWILWFWTKNVFATISFTFSIHLHCSVKNCGCGWIQIILWVMFVEGISSELKILKEQFGISIFVGREHGKWKKP